MNLTTRDRQLLTALVVLLIIFVTFQVIADLWSALARVADVLLIFFAAWLFAYLLGPLVSRIDERTPLNRALSVVVVYIGIAFVLAGVLALVVPGLVAQLNDLVTRAPEYGDRAAREVVGLQQSLERLGVPVNVTDLYGQVPARLSAFAGSIATDALGFVSATATVVFNATLVLIIAFIMLIDGDTLWNRFVNALSPELQSEADLLRRSADRSFGGFIRGSLLLGLIYGIGTLLILVPLGVPFAGVLAVLSGLAMIIPFFGPIIAEVPVLVVALLGAPDAFLWVVVLTVALQQLVLNVIGPRIMSTAIGIHPLFVFFALLLGSRIAGFWGVFLAMPVAGVINTFVRYVYEVARGRRARTQAATLFEERDAAAAAAAADARDAATEARGAARAAREAKLLTRGK
ncbi:MAG: AI-2E family transporter [Chloroflexi bacterium]|nr:MAG: AI-2E family transporter [Chloroflexota bacterium]TMF23236.1 MAG: AI-2E family transporter [Chloroflexota bacterium]